MISSPAIELKPPQPLETSSLSLCTSVGEGAASTSKTTENNATSETELEIPTRSNALMNHAELSKDDMIDDEDFESSSDEEEEEKSEASNPATKLSLFNARMARSVSLDNPKLNSSCSSAKLKKSKSSSNLLDSRQLMANTTESFDSEESDMFHSMCDATKDNWHVDISNINYFLNQTGMQEHPAVRNSMSPITKSTQRMPKSMQVEYLIRILSFCKIVAFFFQLGEHYDSSIS